MPFTSWVVVVGAMLGISAAVAWVAGTIALAHLRPGAWDQSLASALVADYRAAEAAERFVPVSPTIIDDIARDEAARSAKTSEVIVPIFVVGEGNQLPLEEPTPPQDAATTEPGNTGQPTAKPTHTPQPTRTPKPAQTPPDGQPTAAPTKTPKPAQSPPGGQPTEQPTEQPTNTPEPDQTQTPSGGQPTAQPTTTPKPAQTKTPLGGQPTPRPTQPHPTPSGGGGGGPP